MQDKQRRSILIADDKESWRELLVTVLENSGYEVVSVASFRQGQELLETRRFDAAILDMRLVDVSVFNIEGMALLEKAKSLQPFIKAIILTGFPDLTQKARALDYYGADAYVEKAPEGKSFDIVNFTELIARLLRQE